jgi:hypothetical protein
LQQLITRVGTSRVDLVAAQAAAWHLNSKMSWNELAAKLYTNVGGAGPRPYFSREQLYAAQNLVAQAAQAAREEEAAKESDAGEKSKSDQEDPQPRTRVPRTSLRSR